MRARLARLAAIALGALGAFASPAAGACPELPTSQPFASWGDDASYVEAPGGTFEQTLSWDLVGSPSLFQEVDRPGTAVRLRAGDVITSPPLCVNRSYPHARFLARTADLSSHLVTEVLWENDKGKEKDDKLGREEAQQHRGWTPSEELMLAKVLPKDLEGVRDIRLRMYVKEAVGDWLVDDVYVDPIKRG